jgi:type III pantothenate kinase
MSFLTLDVGNTRLKWALYEKPTPGARVLHQGAVFLESIDRLSEDDWSTLPNPTKALGVVVAGEAIRRRVEEQMERWDVTPSWVVPSLKECGITNGYDHPTRLGADRWVAMIGARSHMLKHLGSESLQTKPMVVVMVGTAVTVDAIDTHGHFLGGLILPGHGIMLRALESGTAGLRVPTGEVSAFPTNTSDALTSGGTFAIAGAVERMVQHVRARTQTDPVCIMTGGAGWKMAPSMTTPIELVESLIFEGLLEIAQQRELDLSKS